MTDGRHPIAELAGGLLEPGTHEPLALSEAALQQLTDALTAASKQGAFTAAAEELVTLAWFLAEKARAPKTSQHVIALIQRVAAALPKTGDLAKDRHRFTQLTGANGKLKAEALGAKAPDGSLKLGSLASQFNRKIR